MSQPSEMSEIQRSNRRSLRAFIWVNYAYGINVTEQNFIKNIIFTSFNICLLVLVGIGFIGQINFLIQSLQNNLNEALESICSILQEILAPFKMLLFLIMQPQFADTYRIIESHEIIEKIEILHKDYPFKYELRSKVNKVLDKSWQGVHRVVRMFMVVCSVTFTFYLLSAAVQNIYNDAIGTPNFTILTPFPSAFPFWEDKGMNFPYYHIKFVLIAISLYITALSPVGFDGLFIVSTQHEVLCLKVLRVLLEYATRKDLTRKQRVEYMRYCIKHYNRTYKFYKNINELYRIVGFIQVLLSMLIFGIVMFVASLGMDTATTIKMILFLVSGGFQCAVYCLYGDTVAAESRKTADAFYNCEWYNESKEFRVLVKMMIMRANRIFYMQASGFTVLKLTTFMALIKNSVSYYLLLKNVA